MFYVAHLLKLLWSFHHFFEVLCFLSDEKPNEFRNRSKNKVFPFYLLYLWLLLIFFFRSMVSGYSIIVVMLLTAWPGHAPSNVSQQPFVFVIVLFHSTNSGLQSVLFKSWYQISWGRNGLSHEDICWKQLLDWYVGTICCQQHLVFQSHDYQTDWH